MTLWCCGPACEELTASADEKQAARLRKAQRDYDHVIACRFVHEGKVLDT